MTLSIPVYLDCHATTPVDPRVFEVMRPYFCEIFGNPASTTHAFGWQAEEAVKLAREQVARLIHADPKEILWTSGTTESINLALIGVAKQYQEKGRHIIASPIEHRAVLETLKYLAGLGFEVSYVPVDRYGGVDPDDVKKMIRDDTILITLMGANNEIGAILPIAEIGRIAKEKGVFFHVDAAQICGKIPVDVQEMGIDLLSMSAHKVYGPKGIGALYIRSRNPHVRLAPLIHGGSHQQGLRAGTLPVPQIVGMGKAFEIAEQEMESEAKRLVQLRERLWDGLRGAQHPPKADQPLAGAAPLHINGHPTERLPGNLNVSFPGIKATDLMMKVRDIALSSGSACTSGSMEPSYVLKAIGLSDELAMGSIRFGLGRFTTEEEIDYTIKKIREAIATIPPPLSPSPLPVR